MDLSLPLSICIILTNIVGDLAFLTYKVGIKIPLLVSYEV